MSKPISIGVASDTREFSQGVQKGVIDPLVDAVKALDDVERAGDKAGDQLEGAFEKAQREVSQFKKDQADAARDLSRKWKDAGDDLGDGVKKGTGKATEAVREFGAESKANLAETASSFDGSFESVADGIQGTFGGLAANLGPVGAIGSALVGAGIGVASTMAGDWAAKQEEIRAGFVDMYSEAAQAGRDFLDEAQIQSQVLAILYNEDQSQYKKAVEDAKSTGLSLDVILRAQAGSREDINKVIATSNDLQRDMINKESDLTASTQEGLLARNKTYKELQNITGEYNSQRDVLDELAGKAQLYQDIERNTGQVTNSNLREAERRRDTLGQTVTVPVRVDTRNISEVENRLRRMQERKYEISVGVRYPNGKPVLQ